MSRIEGVALRTAGPKPDDPGLQVPPLWNDKAYREMNRDALLAMAKRHPGRLNAALKQNRIMDEGSQRRNG